MEDMNEKTPKPNQLDDVGLRGGGMKNPPKESTSEYESTNRDSWRV
jgi:hypothetical protein